MGELDVVAYSGLRHTTTLTFPAGGHIATLTAIRDVLLQGGWIYDDVDHPICGPVAPFAEGRWENLGGGGFLVLGDGFPGAKGYTTRTTIVGANNIDGAVLRGTTIAATEENFVRAVNRDPAYAGISYSTATTSSAFTAELIDPPIDRPGFGEVRIRVRYKNNSAKGPQYNGAPISAVIGGAGDNWTGSRRFFGGGYKLLSRQSPWIADGEAPNDWNPRCLLYISNSYTSTLTFIDMAVSDEEEEMVMMPGVSLRSTIGDELYRIIACNYQMVMYIEGTVETQRVAFIAGTPCMPKFMQESSGDPGNFVGKPGIRRSVFAADISQWRSGFFSPQVNNFFGRLALNRTQQLAYFGGQGSPASRPAIVSIRSGSRSGLPARGTLMPMGLAGDKTVAAQWRGICCPVFAAFSPDGTSPAKIQGFLWDAFISTMPYPMERELRFGIDVRETYIAFTNNNTGSGAPAMNSGTLFFLISPKKL